MEIAFADPRRAQERRLQTILARNESCVFGKEHGFASIRSIADFRSRIPLSSYDQLTPWIERMVRGERNILTADDPVFFAVTSGSTGPRKFIPINRDLEKDLAQAQLFWLARLIRDDSRVGERKFLYLAPPAREGLTEGGVPYGSIAGTLFGRQERHVSRVFSAFLSRGRVIPPYVSAVKTPRLKSYLTARLALCRSLGSINSANPSTIVLFFRLLKDRGEALARETRDGRLRLDIGGDLSRAEREDLAERLRPDPRAAARLEAALEEDPLDPRKIWPGLRIVQCWLGGTLSFYVSELRRYTRELPLRDVGYRASEGFFAIPQANETAAGVLHVAGHFLEFLPDDSSSEETLLADELEAGRTYRLIVTQSGGLYRYDLEDIVQVESFYEKTPVVRFLHKAGGTLSVTGEKVTESHLLQAMHSLRAAFGLPEIEFALAVREEIPPRYVLFLEMSGIPAGGFEAGERIGRFLDEELRRRNCEYEAKRTSGRLGPPLVVRLRQGSFAGFRAKFLVLGENDPQYKPRHMISKAEERAWLEERTIAAPFD